MPFITIPSGQPIRLVFLGCGGVTGKHSNTLKRFSGVERWYASRSAANAVAYNKAFKGSGHFDSYQSAIESPDIDVVFVATPPHSHLELTLAAVRAGKHVIVEKPPFLHAGDFDLVASESEKAGVQVMVAENYFYKPLLRRLRQIITSGVAGEIKFMVFNATKTQKTGDWRDEAQIAGGGALFEGGIHWVNFISNLGLKIRSVTGFRPHRRSDTFSTSVTSVKALERSFQVVAEYEEGPIGTLLYSWEIDTLFKGLRLSRIYGTEGSVTFESNGVFIFVRGKKWRFMLLPGLADIGGSKGMFSDFFEALRSGREPAFNLALAKRDVSLIETAYKV